ncbi:MAG TPA: hypothetical protein VL294_07465 [Pseudolysinimonas sp.]|jgi:hypothetical protein|nr:hypothetical protein [Pseudolysinimonas sp.]
MTAATPGPLRSTLQWADLVTGLLLTAIGGLLALVMLSQLAQLAGLSVICEGIAPDGARCSPAFLTGAIIVGYAIVIFAWALGLGLLIVRAVRRRTVFWVPLASVAVIIAAFYLVAIVLSTSYQPTG